MAVQLLDQVGNLPCGDPFPLERDNGRFQVVRPSGIARDQLLVESLVAVPRDRDMEFSILRIQVPFVVTIAAVACIVAGCAVLLVSKEGSQLGFQEVVDSSLKMGTEELVNRLIIQ